MLQTSKGETYLNPVYAHSFPDPFVLKFCGEYWGYCSGIQADGRCFGVIHSVDLVHWEVLDGAMQPLPDGSPLYWAPEVTYSNGHFYLYYSVGDEVNMQMRVAVATHPAGPFVDSGHRLTHEKFAIDGHVLVDDDGKRYLFYATDFLAHPFIGTGTVRDLMLNPFTLAGQPRPVTLPRYDWHVYDPNRLEKGGVRWHTVEGPFVLKRKNLYYEMFSGGNWQNLSYGVSYATTDRVDKQDEWTQVADGKHVLPILRTVPEKVIGPGHNSVVRGLDNQQLFCIYHRWATDERVLAIDPLDWAGERMLILGPSSDPQPVPTKPCVVGFGAVKQGVGQTWQYKTGQWAVTDNILTQSSKTADFAQALCNTTVPCQVVEISLRALAATETGAFGISLHNNDTNAWSFKLLPHEGRAVIEQSAKSNVPAYSLTLPTDFDYQAYHLLRLEWDGFWLKAMLDDIVLRWQAAFQFSELQVGLFTQKMTAAFAGFALTVGWQDLFEQANSNLEALGWQNVNESAGWEIANQQLWQTGNQNAAVITKGPLLENYTLVVNVRLKEATAPDGCYGFYPAYQSQNNHGPLFTVEQLAGKWTLVATEPHQKLSFNLPATFDPSIYQQFRFHKNNAHLAFAWEAVAVGEIETTTDLTRVGLYANTAAVGFDMVRVTETTL